jgi:Domain of unknown function (DUF6766)
VRRFARDNGLSLFFGALFLVTVFAQSIAGRSAYNEQELDHGKQAVTWGRYVTSSAFGQALLENWQSEFLQFTFFIVATIWLVQRGSNETKPIEDIGLETEEQQRLGPHAGPMSPRWARFHGGLRRSLYSNSLLIVMSVIFFLSWFGQSVTGWSEYNSEQSEHDRPTVSWTTYLTRGSFWEATLQNWQSEFLAVGTMAIFTVYLRQRGSPESKPVGAAHDETGASG